MTKEDKEILFKDLSARLLYGVKVRTNRGPEKIEGLAPFCHNEVKISLNLYWSSSISDFTPYLRPMSSMTEEEREEYINIKKGECNGCVLTGKGDPNTEFLLVDFLNSHHFDYRGLIEKGLAIAVTEENNPYE